MGMPAIRRRWSTADVRALTRDNRAWPRYELIDGEPLVTPAPRLGHQVAVGILYRLLAAFLEQHPFALVLTSPSDLELRPGSRTQPPTSASVAAPQSSLSCA